MISDQVIPHSLKCKKSGLYILAVTGLTVVSRLGSTLVVLDCKSVSGCLCQISWFYHNFHYHGNFFE